MNPGTRAGAIVVENTARPDATESLAHNALVAQPLREIHRREGLAGIGPRRDSTPRGQGPEPPVALLLDVDREYRVRAVAGQLPRIAPKRFNPDGRAWLPVLHTHRPGRHVTALYLHTARAHELGREAECPAWHDRQSPGARA